MFVVKVTLSADPQVDAVPPTANRWRWGRLRIFRSVTRVVILLLYLVLTSFHFVRLSLILTTYVVGFTKLR